MSNREVVVLSGVRSAIADFGGSLKDVAPTEVAGQVVAEAVKRSGLEPTDIGHVVIGNVTHSDRRDMYMSRTAALKGGLPIETPALTVNRLCGSGLQSVISAAQMILLGDCDAAVAGGAESMSRVPYWLPNARFGARMGDGQMVDAMMGALTCPMGDTHMGITAENLADKYSVSREEQDELAAESHRRAQQAQEEGRFESQILPIEIKTRKGTVVFDKDEHVRNDAKAEDMAKLRPAFKKDGSVTAGNASGLNDGAAAVVLMERSEAEAKGLKPMAKMVGYAVAAVDPAIMGIGPAPAVRQLMEKTGVAIEDVDIWECNEAFAAQALSVVKELDLDPAKVNPNGSGISLGHPIGATGSMLTVKAVYELERTGARYAVVTMCIGGGQGIAALFERCE
ncbi:acetyl-CoA acetyltransferase [Halioglobus japonicus]|uniref:Acetyl-CoA C-acyltransferase n=1 Tax=Halioglobus japonicus TaxID=930805 RepID=A0AAP8MEF3_9GAMM|nr:acetyl-CoA C-acyltransferase family protein [Halioglobus japonicus]AQA18027.1 acetyl-CoA acetyltransferase [Halioglobus japonicus]PLW86017.1 acetyl-CoA C-acyltransferase [Halioglobus japonicus]GHD14921.1 acetyl-CoA acetyltransferase [Halioglobus japonicus]